MEEEVSRGGTPVSARGDGTGFRMVVSTSADGDHAYEQQEDDDMDSLGVGSNGFFDSDWDDSLESCGEDFDEEYWATYEKGVVMRGDLRDDAHEGLIVPGEAMRSLSDTDISALLRRTSKDSVGDPKENMKQLWALDFWAEMSSDQPPKFREQMKEDVLVVVRGSPNRLIAHLFKEIYENLQKGVEWEQAVTHLSFGHVFLVTFIWFAHPKALMDKLLGIYKNTPAEAKHIENWIPLVAVPTAVCAAIMNWMRIRPCDFTKNEEVKDTWQEFVANIIAQKIERLNLKNINADSPVLPADVQRADNYRLSGDFMVSSTSLASCIDLLDEEDVPAEGKSANEREDLEEGNRKCFDFLDTRLKVFAQQLTLLDYEVFAAIGLEEFHSKAWARAKSAQNPILAPNIYRSIRFFNNVTLWVTAMVLKSESPTVRAQVLTRFVKLADRLLHMRAFNTLMAVHSAINHITIQRMKMTMERLEKKTRDMMESLNEILSPDNNYKNYRTKLAASPHNASCLPYLGVVLRDLTFMDDAQVTFYNDGTINVRKLNMLGEILCPLRNFQLIKPPYEQLPDTVSLMRVMLRPLLNADELYNMSLLREPKKKAAGAEGGDDGDKTKRSRRNSNHIPASSPSYQDLYGAATLPRGKVSSFFGVDDVPPCMPSKASKFFGDAGFDAHNIDHLRRAKEGWADGRVKSFPGRRRPSKDITRSGAPPSPTPITSNAMQHPAPPQRTRGAEEEEAGGEQELKMKKSLINGNLEDAVGEEDVQKDKTKDAQWRRMTVSGNGASIRPRASLKSLRSGTLSHQPTLSLSGQPNTEHNTSHEEAELPASLFSSVTPSLSSRSSPELPVFPSGSGKTWAQKPTNTAIPTRKPTVGLAHLASTGLARTPSATQSPVSHGATLLAKSHTPTSSSGQAASSLVQNQSQSLEKPMPTSPITSAHAVGGMGPTHRSSLSPTATKASLLPKHDSAGPRQDLTSANQRPRTATTISRRPTTLLPKELAATSLAGSPGYVQDPDQEMEIDEMVDSLFRTFDRDNDGIIDKEEFKRLVNNFPFISEFTSLDIGEDIALTRPRLKKYFMAASKGRAQRPRQHVFRPYEAQAPRTCTVCRKLVMNKPQGDGGMLCRECNTCVHVHCQSSANQTACTNPKFVAAGNSGGGSARGRPEVMTNVHQAGYRIQLYQGGC